MKLSPIVVVLLAGLLEPVLIVAVTAVSAILSLGQDIVARVARTASKSTNADTTSDRDAEVLKMPEGGRSVDTLRSAA